MTRVRFDPSLIPLNPDLSFERALWQQGVSLVAGIDEAGRGALAGPVAVGVVILPAGLAELESRLAGVRDSKQMRPEQRDYWAEQIKDIALDWQVGFGGADEIDALGIAAAVRLAAKRALKGLAQPPGHLLIDYFKLKDVSTPQTALVKGDCRSLSIACASVLAKVARDALMGEMDARYPGYGFSRHKGYGTKAHLAALAVMGPCAEHRRSFRPMRGG